MNKTVTFLAFTITLFACTPKIGTKITTVANPLPDSAVVLVFQKNETFMNDGIQVGTIRSGEKGFSTHCSYYQVIGQLKQQARKNGANIIKIVKQKNPDNWSTCVRLKAILYRVPDYRRHEKKIAWSENRKLTWEDFKGKPKPGSGLAAEVACEFGFEYFQPSSFSKKTLIMRSVFDCELSWVNPDQKNRPDTLEFEQLFFDLCELYTRKLRQKLTENRFTTGRLNKESSAIFKEVYKEYQLRQDQYNRETKYGRNSRELAAWSATIKRELTGLSKYSSVQDN